MSTWHSFFPNSQAPSRPQKSRFWAPIAGKMADKQSPYIGINFGIIDLSETSTRLWMDSGFTFGDCDFCSGLCVGKKSSERII